MTPLFEEQFCVYLGGQLVGRLHRRGDVTRFVFEEGYWDNPNRAVLGLRFEEDRWARHQCHLRLPPWFSNLLPEGRLRDWIAQARGASVKREMELLAQVGHDLPGAVRVLPADSMRPVDLSGQGEGPAKQARPSHALWSFSLAGVGLKFSMHALGERLTIPAYGDLGDWIVKLPDSVHVGVPQNERAMMDLAQAVGIEVPEIRLVHRDQIEGLPEQVWPKGEHYAYAVKRFDRGAEREPIHIEDFAQIRGFYPEEKYQGAAETVAALAYRGHDVEALRECVRRLAFNVLIGNGDAHLKNWSLIYRDPRAPTLAPAYDLLATFMYCPALDGPESMALKFAGSKRFADVRLSAFSRLDNKLGAKAELADVARQTAERVLAEWPRAAALLADYSQYCRQIEDFAKARAAQW